MTRRWKIITSLVLSTFVPLSSISICAQEKQPAPDRQMIQRERIPGPDDSQTPPPNDNFIFMASEMNANSKSVKAAPYSAQAITETTQTLSDGNRIVNKSTATIYRDSEGRTRREQTLRVFGSLAAAGEMPQTILINDPVLGESYALDTRSKVAHKMPPMRFEFKIRSSGEGTGEGRGIGSGAGVSVMMRAGEPSSSQPGMFAAPVFERSATPPAGVRVSGPPASQGEGGGMVFERSVAPPPTGEAGMVFQWHGGRESNARTEALGKQMIEGVEAEGTRNTVEIPAGEIGNERPIEMVFERWYSPELQLVVMTKHSDPRFGETTYRLTNISRTEPAHELFEVPADYAVQDFARATIATPIEGISGGILNGKATSLPVPEYPPIAKAARASGSVTVQITIDEDGNVVSARAVSGHPLLQAAAVNAARQAKFSPTKLNGQPVKVNGALVYTFAAQ
ncbi:MAG: energy transducer TonB [Acidobacteriota bacterium]